MGANTSHKKGIRILCILGIGTCLCLILARYAFTYLNVSEEIHPVISQMLETLDIHECTLIQLSDYNDIRVSIETPIITEDEYAGYIRSQREEEDTDLTDDELRHQLLEEKKNSKSDAGKGQSHGYTAVPLPFFTKGRKCCRLCKDYRS